MNVAADRPSAIPADALRRSRVDALTVFGIVVVAVLMVALALTGLIQNYLIERGQRAAVISSAPATMSLLTRAVHECLLETPERLPRLVEDLCRAATVQAVRLKLEKPQPAQLTTGHAEESALWLSARLNDPAGTIAGNLEVAFGAAPQAVGLAPLWTTRGLMLILALAGFAVVYRRLRRHLRPMASLRENLLAYRSGREPSVELLGLQDTHDELACAWNQLIDFVRELRTELDAYRCRETVTGALGLLHGQSAQKVLDLLPVGVLRIDSQERVQYANSAGARMLRLREGGAVPVSLAQRLPDAALVAQINGLRAPREQGDRSGFDYLNEHAGHAATLRITPIQPTDDRDELVLMIQDISRLKEAERSRDDFLAHITHELRTPLTNIRAYTETLTEDFFDDEQTRRQCYNVIMSETRRLSQLIEDVLSVSQFEAGALRLEQTEVRVDQVLRQVVQEVQAAADAKQIDLALKIPSKVPLIQGDRHRLHQVWMNLIGNAIKYTPAEGAVTVAVGSETGRLIVRITDTGIGISPEHHERIFEKFYRVKDPAVEAEVGSGLGLAITRDIVRRHGGEIRVESAAGAGSTFIVDLPAAATGEAVREASDGTDRNR